jgi:hypothetical protein
LREVSMNMPLLLGGKLNIDASFYFVIACLQMTILYGRIMDCPAISTRFPTISSPHSNALPSFDRQHQSAVPVTEPGAEAVGCFIILFVMLQHHHVHNFQNPSKLKGRSALD